MILAPHRLPFRKRHLFRALLLLTSIALGTVAPAQQEGGAEGSPGRYVRIELSGEERILSLAEVQVLRGDRNLTIDGIASQSSIASNGAAARAIDGETNGNYPSGSVTHTPAITDPWWEVDLQFEQPIDQITIWNRTDCCQERLEGFRVVVLNEAREVVWSVASQPAPSPRADYSLWGAPIVQPGIPPVDRARLQPGIDDAIDRGVQYLLETQLRDGSWHHVSDKHRSGQTALSVYALVKSGVPRKHPAIGRALEYIRHNPPVKTYPVSCVLMALESMGDPELLPWMGKLLEDLIDWQGARGPQGTEEGMWGYPQVEADLSNTQYAALGLRAAARAGLKVPAGTWRRLLVNTLEYQEPARKVEGARAAGRTTTDTEIAGFRYRKTGAHAKCTGSMTTAGIGVLRICEQALGDRLESHQRRAVRRGIDRGMNWLAHHFSVTGNPMVGGGWKHYYLYGLERVGALLATDRIGTHDWYWEGSKHLVKEQEGEGRWKGESETCFALLFLSKATAKSTGPRQNAKEEAYIAENEASDVRWRMTGDQELTMWVTGFGAHVLEEFTDPEGELRGLRVNRVEYLRDGELVATVEGNPQRPWKGERFATRHRLPGPGVYRMEVIIVVLDPHGESDEETAEFASDPLDVECRMTHEEWMLEYPEQGVANLLRKHEVKATSSSRNNDGQAPGKAVDGFHGTYWVPAFDDEKPTITLELRRSIRANTIRLSHVNLNTLGQDNHARATRVHVLIDKAREPLEFELSGDDRRKSTLRLEKPQRIRRFSIEIVDLVEGHRWPRAVGFSEIELFLER